MARLENSVRKWARGESRQLHRDIFTAARFCIEDGWDRNRIFEFLRKACNVTQARTVPDREIHSAIDYAFDNKPSKRWPSTSADLRSSLVMAYGNSDRFSKVPLRVRSQKQLLSGLFLDNEFVCVGDISFSVSKPLADWTDAELSQAQYLVPNPMRGAEGLTYEGKPSAHSLSNVHHHRHLVVEFDSGGISEHLSVLDWLSNLAPLQLIVFSGSKSMHGWFYIEAMTEDAREAFFTQAVRAGADPTLWSPVQFTRLPLGFNSKSGVQQTVHYINFTKQNP